MNIITLIKQVPDVAKLSQIMDPLKLINDKEARVINPWDEYAIETGIRLKETYGGKVIALSLGEPQADDILRRSLAMGVDEAVLISDPLLKDSDSLATARALAAAINKIGDFDIIIAGRSAIDGNNAATAIQAAVLLGIPQISYVAVIRTIDPLQKTISVMRLIEGGYETIKGKLPLAISVVKEINEPRHPSFIGIRKASKANIPIWDISYLGLNSNQVGLAGSLIQWVDLNLPPMRGESAEILKGHPEEVAKMLANKLSSDKVL